VDFAFSSDQQLLRNAARAFLDERCSPAVVRALWDEPRGEGDALWKELAQLGWLGLALPEPHAGSGLGMVETAIVLEELGRAAYPGPYLPTVLAGLAIARAGTEGQQARWLPAIATGTARATVAFLDGEVAWEPEAVTTRAEPAGGGMALTGVKAFVPWGHVADVLVVPARGADGVSLYLVEATAPGLHLTPAVGMDPGTRWTTVRLERTPVAAAGRLGPAGGGPEQLGWLLPRAAVAAAAEMLGAARRALDMSVAYAKVREQFGQPVGSFQAVRHKCAEMLLEVENAHAATYYAAWALDAGADDADVAASIAKAYVGDAARRVTGDAIQVHGGIGFTWEYDLHLYFKRVKALEAMYGDGDHHRELIVRQVAGGSGSSAGRRT
jgi:alkylation response protein AidB-like acyl-CoA dehydrogenase